MKKLISAAIVIIFTIFLFASCSVTIEEMATPDKAKNEVQNGVMTLSVVDVGQGDCILIKTPNERYIIVDSGSTNEKDKLYAYLESTGMKTVEAAIATHPHEDHIGNLDNIIDDYNVNNLYMPRASANTKAFENLLNAINKKGLKIKTAKAGAAFEVDGVSFEFLAPNRDEYKDTNNYSGVLKVSYGKKTFLLMGDAEKLSEDEILESGADVSADVIKAGHHGSSTSSSKNFIKAVNPAYVVISCGRGNDYNHPHMETISLFNDLKIDILRTDLKGTITFTTDGIELTIL